jgi:preprotein translocase subunit SecA
MFNFVKKIFGDSNDRAVKQIEPIVRQINSLEEQLKALSDAQLRAKTDEFRAQLAKGDTLDDILPDAFATVREVSRRTIGHRHYDVQMIGGIVLHRGTIAEMRTGEGKTLVATLPLYLNALQGKGSHLITVNDYLAKVGAGWMGPIYHRLGLTVALIAHDYSAMFDPEYRDEKANQEDQRLVHWRPCTRREAYHADITYGTNNEFGFDYLRDNMARDLSQLVQRELHYAIVDEVDNILIDEARTPLIISGPSQQSSEEYKRFARLVPSLRVSPYTPDQVKKDMIDDPQGDFLIDPRSKSIQITDTGIHKIERAIGIPADESLYDPKYYEMTHFLENALRAQFIYHRDRDYVVERGEVVIVDEFTGRKMPGRRWSDGLHQAVEAKENVQVKQENVTLATITFQNYFRMYSKLCGMTGTAYTEREELGKIYNLDVVIIPTNKPMVRKDMDDHVYVTEKAKFEAVIRDIEELRAQGRPVLVGTTSVETSERLSKMMTQEKIPHQVLNAKFHELEAGIIAQAGRIGAITIATNMAGRGTDILLGGNPDGLIEELLAAQKLKYEQATPEQRAEALTEARRLTAEEGRRVREVGGLHIIGTERHEARRIDNQLRGRAGRQGDPGSSRFYLSLEDELLRRFAMDRVRGLMERIGVDDGMPIEAGMLSRIIENAQHKVEGYNFDLRKHTVDFDDVMNQQRTVIYVDRREILYGKNMREQVLDMIHAEIEAQVDLQLGGGEDGESEADFAALLRAMRTIDPRLPAEITPETLAAMERDELIDMLYTEIEDAYAEREQAIGEENMRFVERSMMLAGIDNQWIDYLTGMEDLRQEIGLQAIAQRDPLTEYQRNASIMFTELKENIQRDIVYRMIPISYQYEQHLRQVEIEQQQRMAVAQQAGASEEQVKAARTVRKESAKVGRNDPCPCGSGKKFKHCHEGREAELVKLIPSVAAAAQPAASPSAAQQLATKQSPGVQRGRSAPPTKK